MITLHEQKFSSIDELKSYLSEVLGDNTTIIVKNEIAYNGEPVPNHFDSDSRPRDTYSRWHGVCVLDGPTTYPVYPSTTTNIEWIKTYRVYFPEFGLKEAKDFYDNLPSNHPDKERIVAIKERIAREKEFILRDNERLLAVANNSNRF